MLNQTKYNELRDKQAEYTALHDREAARERDLADAEALAERLVNTLHQALSDPRSTWAAAEKLEADLLVARQKVDRLLAEKDPTVAGQLDAMRDEVIDRVYELSGKDGAPEREPEAVPATAAKVSA